MFHFGKSKSNRKALIRRRKFDTLVQVGPRMSNSSANDTTYDFAQYYSKAKKRSTPKTTVVINSADYYGEYELNGPDLSFRHNDPFMPPRPKYKYDWLGRKVAINKPKPRELGDLFLEPDLDGEEKLATMMAREWETSTERSSRTWKNSNPNATKQWARHKPKFHVLWTIGEETSATFLVWNRENDQAEREYAEVVAREIESEYEVRDLSENAKEIAYWENVAQLEELKRRYDYGDWCLKFYTKPDLDNFNMLDNYFGKGAKAYQRAA